MTMSWTAESLYGVPPSVPATGTGAPAADPAIVSPVAKRTGLAGSASLAIVLLVAMALGLVGFTIRAGR